MVSASDAPSAQSRFSVTQPGGTATAACSAPPATIVREPCNLEYLEMTRGPADGEDGTAVVVRWQEGVKPRYNASPLVLGARVPLQIVAPSKHGTNKPRKVTFAVHAEATCDSRFHPMAWGYDSMGSADALAPAGQLQFHRPWTIADQLVFPDFLSMLSTLFGSARTESYLLDASACGVPLDEKGRSSRALQGMVEIFPADTYALKLKIPAFRPKALQVDRNFGSWRNDDDAKRAERRLNREVERVRDEAGTSAADRAVSDFLDNWVGERDEGKFQVELTSVDGLRERSADPATVLRLLQMIRDAGDLLRTVSRWISNIQVGWGASLEVDCQFLVADLSIEWGYCESAIDHRVFRRMKGEGELQIMQLDVEGTVGWKLAGAADAYLTLSGSGKIGLSFEVAREGPDDSLGAKIEPEGEVEIELKVTGEIGWLVKMEGKASIVFTADFPECRMRGGGDRYKITIKHSAAVFTYEASCAGVYVFSGAFEECIAKNDRLYEFEIGAGEGK
jgi:hypothetical protein